MAYSNEVTLKEAIQELLDHYKIRGKLNENRLTHSWEKIMGKVIANHTTNVYVKEGVLYIKLDSSVLRQELGYAKTKIIDRINEELEMRVVDDVVLM